MDVLKEIAQVEGRARDSKQDFKKKAKALAVTTKERLARSLEESEKALEGELASLKAELEYTLKQEKAKVTEAGRQAQATLERQVRENASRAVQLILKEIGL